MTPLLTNKWIYCIPVLWVLLTTHASIKAQSREASQVSVSDFDSMAALKTAINRGDKMAKASYDLLMDQAEEAMQQGPFSVVHKTGTPPSGDKHDYMSMGPYWWPNPDTPDQLPYIRKDGEVNPEARNRHTDYTRKNACYNAIGTLGLAFYYSEDPKYAQKSIALIDAWFIDPETKMNPNLNFGQGVPGRSEGRPYGIIEFRSLEQVIKTLEMLQRMEALPADTEEEMQDWLYQFVNWLQTSELGTMEGTRKNNHATWYDVQVCNILIYLGEVGQVKKILEAVKEKRIATQIEPDGSQPLELARTKSFSYSTMNLAGFTELARLGKMVGVDLWNYQTQDGRSIRKAYEFLIPFITTDKPWEYQQLDQSGDYKERFRKLVAQAGKEFNEEWLLKITEDLARSGP